MDVGDVGRWLLVVAAVTAVAGVLLTVAGWLGLGRLPGDLSFGNDRFRVYVPVVSCIVVSLVATILLNLLLRR